VTGTPPPSPGNLKRSWRWYRSPGSDREVAREDMASLTEHGRAALLEAIGRFRRGEERRAEVKKLQGCQGLWEIRVRVEGDSFRALFFYDVGAVCVCVCAIQKDQQRLPKSDRDRALERMALWQNEGKRRRKGPPR
jgi:phage-related protein